MVKYGLVALKSIHSTFDVFGPKKSVMSNRGYVFLVGEKCTMTMKMFWIIYDNRRQTSHGPFYVTIFVNCQAMWKKLIQRFNDPAFAVESSSSNTLVDLVVFSFSKNEFNKTYNHLFCEDILIFIPKLC